MSKDEVKWVIRVGGSSRIPLFERLLKVDFPNAQHSAAVDENLAVAQGAALQAALLTGEAELAGDMTLVDCSCDE